MDRDTATGLVHQFRIDLERDFHALGSEQVERIIAAADAHKYRKPKTANGSRARYFHAALRRALAR